jgi:hypothetical protein
VVVDAGSTAPGECAAAIIAALSNAACAAGPHRGGKPR